jgi:hypothetical protein
VIAEELFTLKSKASQQKQQRHCRSRHCSTGTGQPMRFDQSQNESSHVEALPGVEVGGNRSVPSPPALRTFSASAWSASSSALPRHGCGGPQAPWPNQALHRTAQKSAPPVNLGVDMTSAVKCSRYRFFGPSSWRPLRPWGETEPVNATVDHADIRGLATTLLVSVGRLPRSRHERLFQALNVHEGYAKTGAASLPMA